MSEHPLEAKVRDLEARNRELAEQVRTIGIQALQHSFVTVIDALQYGSLTTHDLVAAVSVERVRAALFVPPFTPHA